MSYGDIELIIEGHFERIDIYKTLLGKICQVLAPKDKNGNDTKITDFYNFNSKGEVFKQLDLQSTIDKNRTLIQMYENNLVDENHKKYGKYIKELKDKNIL